MGRVLAMVMLDMGFYGCAVCALLCAFLSRFHVALGVVAAGLLFVMMYTVVASVPLKLNWSRNFYGPLLRRAFGFFLFCIIIFSVVYDAVGIIDAQGNARSNSYLDALYFSVMTWTTFEYGEFRPAAALRLVVALQVLLGLLFVPIISALMWLYCSERLGPRSAADLAYEGLEIRHDPALGVWRDLPGGEREKREAEERARRLRLNACSACGQSPSVDKYYEIIGRITPLARFDVVCACGRQSGPRLTAYRAASKWNKRNRSS